MRWYTATVEAALDAVHDADLGDTGVARRVLVELADLVGPGQSAYDPQVVVMDGPDGGVSGSCLFPGGHVTIHTWIGTARIPSRYRVDVTASDPVDTAAVAAAVATHLGPQGPA